MSPDEDQELIAEAWQALEALKCVPAEVKLRHLMDEGIIDEDGQVILDLQYGAPLSNGANGTRKHKEED